MADELDKLTEEEQVEAELKRLREQQPPGDEPPQPDLGVPPPEPEKPAEPPPAEAKKVERTPEEEMREGTLRRLLREERQRRERLEREIDEARRAKPAETSTEKPKEPTKDDEPVEYFDREIQRLRQQLSERDQRDQQTQALLAVQRQEDEFRRSHPDYQDALNHLESTVEKQWERSGLATAQVNQLREAVRLGRGGNAQYKMYADKLDEVSQWTDVQETADKQGREPEDVALWKIARDTYIQGERQKVWQGAQATRRNIAEIAYEMAQDVGYKPKAASGSSPPSNPDAERQKVLNSQRIGEAAKSLSETSGGEGITGPRVIRNRQEILNLSDSELDQLIESGAYREL